MDYDMLLRCAYYSLSLLGFVGQQFDTISWFVCAYFEAVFTSD